MRGARKARADCDQGKILHDSLWRLDQGFATAVLMVVIALSSTLLTGLGLAISLAQGQVRTQLIADTAALTAADTMLGAVAGFPCENAELIVAADGAFLSSCRIVGLGAVVRVTQNLGFIQVEKVAQAAAQAQ